MQKSMYVLIFFFSALSMHAQAQEKSYTIEIMPEVAMMPVEFQGTVDTLMYYDSEDLQSGIVPVNGWDALFDLLEKTPYPEEAKKNGQQASVQIDFQVDRQGKLQISSVFYQFDRGNPDPCPSCMKLARKIIEDLKWSPAQINGVKVNAHADLILDFSIR